MPRAGATVSELVPEPLVIDEEEAFTFCANSVVVGDVVVMPQGSPLRVARQLERWGFTVAMVDVSELHKGGGSIRCMTLPLDTRLDDRTHGASRRSNGSVTGRTLRLCDTRPSGNPRIIEPGSNACYPPSRPHVALRHVRKRWPS